MASCIIGLGAFGKKMSWLSMIDLFAEIFPLQNVSSLTLALFLLYYHLSKACHPRYHNAYFFDSCRMF